MKLGVITVLFGDMPLDAALKKVKTFGIETVEIGCGGFPGKQHCDPAVLLADEAKLEEFKETFKRNDIEICALSSHGNMVHPLESERKRYSDDLDNAILLAEKLGIDTVVTFSGCPGGSPEDKTPNWITCPWPHDFSEALEYQWNEVLIPYWKKECEFARAHGVTKIALEMHPGFCVYNPETLLRLRDAVGDTIGANLDPSHLIWQGIDPVEAIRQLAGAIYHFHAKDTKVDRANTLRNGVLDTKSYDKVLTRAWSFRSVGYGNGLDFWREIVSNLRLVGYDKVISIEHEDILMTSDEGLRHAADFLLESIIREPSPTTAYWV